MMATHMDHEKLLAMFFFFTEPHTMKGDAIRREDIGPRHKHNSAAWGTRSNKKKALPHTVRSGPIMHPVFN